MEFVQHPYPALNRAGEAGNERHLGCAVDGEWVWLELGV